MTKIFKSNGTKMIVDILCLLLLSAALVTVNFFMEPHKRGFFCDDQTLMYPYIAHTVFSTSKVIILGFVFLFLIIIAEIFLGRKNRRQPLKLFYYNIPNWGFFSYHTCYLQSRMTSSILKIPKHLLQAALVLMISFISMTRISNYRHHWSDVAAGILIGSANALITVFIMANLFKKDQPEKVEHDYQLDHEQQRDIDNYIEDRNNNTINVYPKMDVEMII
ncbi:hypothetical protein G9C98_001291 [Cotesia typhae]|uniref:Phosphatidic acid phosphatase type 2/haloperoxidase domain-containing protein n=1 Tax=Cotesia typhae TaxID=2053667 RepID=A0A8J5QY13_9HYME|nr:hypothetical protein G9C98_001291 [Cotesia typhae]